MGEISQQHENSENAGCSESLNVIYIAGWGHSGSTLLCLLSGSAPAVFPAGELLFFEDYRDEISTAEAPKGNICTCGARFSECPIWSRLSSHSGIQDIEIIRDDGYLDRLGWLWRLLIIKKIGIGNLDTKIANGELTLLRGITHVTGNNFICDSSKDFARLARLAMIPDINITPVLLIRESAGVVYSYTKRARERRYQTGLPVYGFSGALARWFAVNILTMLTIKMAGLRSNVVFYDHLCQDPQFELSRIYKAAGLQYDVHNPGDSLGQKTYHNLGGNLMRFDNRTGIVPDQEAKVNLSSFQRRICNAADRFLSLFISS